jgi:hypothetical protein
MESFSDFVNRICAILPDAVFSEDGDGQIVVSTGFCSNREGVVVPFEGAHPDDAIVVVQPHGCDGLGKYAYDPKAEDGRGKKLASKCPGCRACS